MAPCIVVERLEGKQQYSRAPVGKHTEVQAQDAECGCHEDQEVNEKRPKPRNSLLHNHDSKSPDNIRSSILVRGRSIRSMARSGRQPWRPLPQKVLHYRHFGRHCPERIHGREGFWFLNVVRLAQMQQKLGLTVDHFGDAIESVSQMCTLV